MNIKHHSLLICLLLMLLPITSYAELYKCVDDNGRVKLDDKPCDSSSKTEKIYSGSGSSNDESTNKITDKEEYKHIDNQSIGCFKIKEWIKKGSVQNKFNSNINCIREYRNNFKQKYMFT